MGRLVADPGQGCDDDDDDDNYDNGKTAITFHPHPPKRTAQSTHTRVYVGPRSTAAGGLARR